jgi:hypothetical protein
MGFGGAIEFTGVLTLTGPGPQGGVQSFLDKALAHARHRGAMHFQGFADGFVTPGRSGRIHVGLQQKAGRQEPASSGFTTPNHLRELSLFVRR